MTSPADLQVGKLYVYNPPTMISVVSNPYFHNNRIFKFNYPLLDLEGVSRYTEIDVLRFDVPFMVLKCMPQQGHAGWVIDWYWVEILTANSIGWIEVPTSLRYKEMVHPEPFTP